MDSFQLKPSTYLIGDPGLIFKKIEGRTLTDHLWKKFYQNPKKFHEMNIDGITFYITKTKEGDGYFEGVGTDSGTIMIIDLNAYQHDPRIQMLSDRKGILTLDITKEVTVMVDNHILMFKLDNHILYQIRMFD